MQVRYTSPRRPRRRQSSPVGAVVAIVLVLTLAGCAALGAEPMIALIGQSVPLRSLPARSLPAPAVVAQPTALADLATTPIPAAVAAATPSAAATLPPDPTPRPTRKPKPTPRLKHRPRPGPFAMNLYRRGDFVSQLEPIWCTAAAMQVMVNIMKAGSADTSSATQARLYRLGQRHSTWRLEGAGIEPEGIVGTLEQLGYGQWEIQITKGRYWAYRGAVRALRMTNRPVAMTTWRGAHTWVISGFRATADPAYTNDYEVTDLYIQDVWYPRVSSIWGASNPPDTLVPVERLPADYLPFARPGVRYPGKDGNFLMIIPVAKGQRR
jgi:hypothetical protein